MNTARLVLPVMLAAALVGCSSTKPPEPAAPVVAAPVAPPPPVAAPVMPAPPAAPVAATPPAAQSAPTVLARVSVHPLDDPTSVLAKRSVYFEFDSALLRDADLPVIDAHSKYLESSRTAKVRIEGNCDERGGREYNVALGQRRAEAVLKSLRLMGIPARELEAVSFGKEKPVDTGHNETAWAKNRRADLNYLSR
jgi:peptidoglycan-associated lipoprotein